MKKTVLAAALATLIPVGAQAHFLLQHTDEVLIDRPGDVPVGLIFWHPMENGHAMDMDAPQEFFMIHNGEKTDLMDRVAPATFKGKNNEAAAFTASVPVKRSGDYVVVTVPAPYYEESEDIYIQQITKSVLNRNTLPTDWDQPVGLPTEILPLNKPYNVVVGSTFSGVVLSEGKPVAAPRSRSNTWPPSPTLPPSQPPTARSARCPAAPSWPLPTQTASSPSAFQKRAIGALRPWGRVQQPNTTAKS